MSMTDKAYQRSMWLLADHLSPYQSMIAGLTGYIPVVDANNEVWVILPATIQSVYNMDQSEWYCLTSEDHFLPHGDVILGIFLNLQNDIEHFYEQARKLENQPATMDRIEEMLYRAVFANSNMVQPGDNFFDDQCEKCNYNDATVIRDLCDYHRGLRHGMIITSDLETMLRPIDQDFSFFEKPRRDGISSLTFDFLLATQEVNSFAKMDDRHRELYAAMLRKGIQLPTETQADIVKVFWTGYKIVGHEALVAITALLHEEKFRLYPQEDPAVLFDILYEATKRDLEERAVEN